MQKQSRGESILPSLLLSPEGLANVLASYDDPHIDKLVVRIDKIAQKALGLKFRQAHFPKTYDDVVAYSPNEKDVMFNEKYDVNEKAYAFAQLVYLIATRNEERKFNPDLFIVTYESSIDATNIDPNYRDQRTFAGRILLPEESFYGCSRVDIQSLPKKRQMAAFMVPEKLIDFRPYC